MKAMMLLIVMALALGCGSAAQDGLTTPQVDKATEDNFFNEALALALPDGGTSLAAHERRREQLLGDTERWDRVCDYEINVPDVIRAQTEDAIGRWNKAAGCTMTMGDGEGSIWGRVVDDIPDGGGPDYMTVGYAHVSEGGLRALGFEVERWFIHAYPSVAPDVIAHEIGHLIGARHVGPGEGLMGRPSLGDDGRSINRRYITRADLLSVCKVASCKQFNPEKYEPEDAPE